MTVESFPTIEHNVDDDSFYVTMSDKPVYQTKRATMHVIVDLDEDGFIVGLKILEIGARVPYIFLQHNHGLSFADTQKIESLLAYKK